MRIEVSGVVSLLLPIAHTFISKSHFGLDMAG